jgi:hypothetical protein
VFLLQDRDTQPIYRLSDFTNAKLIQANAPNCKAGKISRTDRLHLVIDLVCSDTVCSACFTAHPLADGAGGSPIV